jgi:hypothetical protein
MALDMERCWCDGKCMEEGEGERGVEIEEKDEVISGGFLL